MSKLTKLLSIFLLLIALTPHNTQAHSNQTEHQPIKIKSATIETKGSRVIGEVEVCNNASERVRFVLDMKNVTINSIYKRKLSVPADDCVKTALRFKRDFAEMSNTGDVIEMTAKHARGLSSRDKYDFSKVYTTTVAKGARDYSGCADQEGDDGIFTACETDFINHLPSGLRIKVVEKGYGYTELKLTHIEWGGVKRMRLYKGRTKKIRSNYDELKRLEISNVYGENTRDLLLKIESAS